jgi:hypothetical protein
MIGQKTYKCGHTETCVITDRFTYDKKWVEMSICPRCFAEMVERIRAQGLALVYENVNDSNRLKKRRCNVEDMA